MKSTDTRKSKDEKTITTEMGAPEEIADFAALNSTSSLQIKELAPDIRTLTKSTKRKLCGEIDMRIGVDGTWYYKASPIGRKELVKLFSSVLRRDDNGDFWLITPAEMARIRVDDAPFIVKELTATGNNETQLITFRTNVDTKVLLSEEHPLFVFVNPVSNEPRPYITIKPRLDALILRSVFYQLVEIGTMLTIDGNDVWGVWSNGNFFPISAADSI